MKATGKAACKHTIHAECIAVVKAQHMQPVLLDQLKLACVNCSSLHARQNSSTSIAHLVEATMLHHDHGIIMTRIESYGSGAKHSSCLQVLNTKM